MRRGAATVMILLLFPILPGLSQTSEAVGPDLGVVLTSFSPHHYVSDDGRTVVVGEVRNTRDFPVSGVKIWAGFFDDVNRSPLEWAVGTSLLEVIPAGGTSPYRIHSTSPNPAITGVSVNLLGFTSSGTKLPELALDGNLLHAAGRLSYSGTVTNGAGTAADGTRVHLALYDAFEPPRLLRVDTVEFGEPIAPGASAGFYFEEEAVVRAVGFYVLAESGNSLSNVVDAKIIPPEPISKRITINDVSLVGQDGERVSGASVGSPVSIKSSLWIQVASEEEDYYQDYVYYAQVKRSGEKALVEHIGTFEGSFVGPAPQDPTAKWIPESPGLYFVETFVWDPSGVALSSKGPIALVLVD